MAEGFAQVASQFARSTYALREYVRSIRPIVARDALKNLLAAAEASLKMESLRDDLGNAQTVALLEQLRNDINHAIDAPSLSGISVLEKYVPSEEEAQKLIQDSMTSLRELAVTKLPPLAHLAQPAKNMLVSIEHAQLLHESALIAVLIYFEALVYRVLSVFYHLRPQALSGDNKILSFNELKGFADLDEATDYLVSERVDAQMRESIEDWRAFFKKQLKIDLASLAPWDDLVEVYQRRNLVVHNSGVVSRAYLARVSPSVAAQVSPPPKLGAPLQVSKPYLDRAIELFTMAGLGLVDQCWQRLIPEESQARDQVLAEVMTDVLLEPAWSLLGNVCQLLLKRPLYSESNRLRAQVNFWLAEKRLGHWERVRKEVMRFDRAACHPAYAICVCSLLEDVEGFFRYLPAAVSGGVDRHSLETWPILDEMRSDPRFIQSVSDLFPDKQPSCDAAQVGA